MVSFAHFAETREACIKCRCIVPADNVMVRRKCQLIQVLRTASKCMYCDSSSHHGLSNGNCVGQCLCSLLFRLVERKEGQFE